MQALAEAPLISDRDQPKTVSILGVTGSIGQSTIDVISHHRKSFEIEALTGNRNWQLLAKYAKEFGAKFAVIGDPDYYEDLKTALSGTDIEVAAGDDAVIEAASRHADCYMAAIVGAAGLRPTLEAVRQGTRVALANKECLVCAGPVFMAEVEASKTNLIPVDSEHSAAFQSIGTALPHGIERLLLTASGGPFRMWPIEKIAKATKSEALAHPNWSMGEKITIDSATLMNKGLELIEAFHLFPVTPDQLDVIIHPQSIVHCLVEYADGSVLAQMSSPDMRTPIAYSLSWPERMTAPTRPLDLAALGALTFEAPDEERFPALRIARNVLNDEGRLGAALNAANEVAVEAYLTDKIDFLSITSLVEETLNKASEHFMLPIKATLQDIIDIDHEARQMARVLCTKFNNK